MILRLRRNLKYYSKSTLRLQVNFIAKYKKTVLFRKEPDK